MLRKIQVMFTPAEFAILPEQKLDDTVCVVFDVLRATSTIAIALHNGAAAIIPVQTIEEALNLRAKNPDLLLAGERHGLRISGSLSGGTEFDLANSPREFSADRVYGRTIVTTTTNGTRALRACAHAGAVLAGSFLNLQATAEAVLRSHYPNLVIVCAGTHEQSAYEDTLGAGALIDLLLQNCSDANPPDSVKMAHLLFRHARSDLPGALASSQNGRRLTQIPELKDDVAFCAALNRFPMAIAMDSQGLLTRLT